LENDSKESTDLLKRTDEDWMPPLIDSENEDDDENNGGKGDADQPKKKKKKNNMIPLSNFFQTGARYGESQRQLVSTGNALIKDLKNAGIEIPDELVLCKSKVHFGQNVLFTKLSSEPCPDTKALSLDGKIFETLEHETYGENSERNIIYKRDNFAVCDGCTQQFIGQFKVTSGTGCNTAEGLRTIVEKKQIDKRKINFLITDSTKANSGKYIGFMSSYEELLGHSCHNGYCCFHLNELELRHHITHFLGVSSSPNGLAGDIGKALKDLKPENVLPEFTAFPNPNFYQIPPEVVKTLSRDQKVFHQLLTAVMEGKCSRKLAETVMPGINLARWLTLAIRILFYFMTLKDPPPNLVKVVKFIIYIYGSNWFEYKSHPNCLDTPRIMFKVDSRIRQ
jgi:hypothetical protein